MELIDRLRTALLSGPGFAPDSVAPEPVPDETERLIFDCDDGLRVLLWLAQADGEIASSEMDVITDYIRWRVKTSQIAGYDPDGVGRWVQALIPSYEDFVDSLEVLLQSDRGHAIKVMEFAAQLVIADGKITMEERADFNVLIEQVEGFLDDVRPHRRRKN